MLDFSPNDLPNMRSHDMSVITQAEKVAMIEKQITNFKELEKRYKEEKEKLYCEMIAANVKKFTLPNGTSFTVVDEIEGKWVDTEGFDKEAFRKDHEDLYQQYMKVKREYQNGRKGYVKVTLGKKND